MDKAALITMFITFATSNDVLKYQAQNTDYLDNSGVTSTWNKPKFCNNLDCPEYTVIKKATGYEERLYSESNWVSTNMSGIDYNKANSAMFMKLFGYIQKQNVKKEKIDMTCPVTNRIIPAQGPACESDFIMSFYISPKIVQAPEPTGKDVFLVKKPALNVYVRQFSGFTRTYDAWRKEAVALGEALKRDGLQYEEAFYFTAGYDAPFKLFNRHNEIWFMKKE